MEKYYQSMLSYIHQRPYLKKSITWISHFFPYILFVLYPWLLIYLMIIKSHLFLETVIKPLSAFLLVTILRKVINRARPYETMNIESLLQHKKGESFPSRHAVSAMIIALVCFNVNYLLGIIALCIALVICISRIVTGVHYISDVFVSIIIAFLIYFI